MIQYLAVLLLLQPRHVLYQLKLLGVRSAIYVLATISQIYLHIINHAERNTVNVIQTVLGSKIG